MNAQVKIESVTVRDALRGAMAQLQAARVPSHSLAAELLLMHALGHDRAWVYAHPDATIDEDGAKRLLGLVAKRASGVPTQYLTGKQEFWGLEFEVTPAVLIPRPETEHVIEVAIERLGEQKRREELRIADVGTGSGCIAVALAHELPGAKVLATDVSVAALEVARRNADKQGVSQRIRFVQCDLLAGAAGEQSFDLIASNPPYVAQNEEAALPREVREHEPREALYGGATGIEIYSRLVEMAGRFLRAGGWLVLEIGHDTAERICVMFNHGSWRDIRVTNDLAGIARVISAQRAE